MFSSRFQPKHRSVESCGRGLLPIIFGGVTPQLGFISLKKHMKQFILISALSLSYVFSAATPTFSADEPPPWAYPVNPPGFKPRPEDSILRRVPGSSVTYSVTQLSNRFLAPIWHPDDHPPLPQIVATGRKPNVLACGFCHRADGSGGPENSSLAGLPAAYIVQQMADFKTSA